MHKIILNDKYNHIHFIGIGGISMSGLAEMLCSQQNLTISGSDLNESKLTEHLRKIGIKIYIGNSKDNIKENTDLVVYTAAVKPDNEELLEAQRKNIAIIDRAELLGQIMKNFDYPISITGSHGKTSTTSMLSEVFISSGCDPTIAVGGNLPIIGGNIKLGDSEYFVVESDEYYDSFLKFYPRIAVILNIDMDHSDYFKNYDRLWQSFKKFAGNIPDIGALVVNQQIPRLTELVSGLKCRIITYGDENSDWYASNINFRQNGCASFDVIHKGSIQGNVQLNVVGSHNVLNALAVFAMARESGLDNNKIITGLMNYKGVDRRFQVKGTFKGMAIIDDYAHHPTEIKATLAAAQNIASGKIYCVFQPHTYSRTKYLFNEFVHSFDDADKIIITNIFAARESDNNEIHSRDLVEKLIEIGKEAYYFDSFDSAEKFIINDCCPDDMLITMGAGNIYLLGDSLVNSSLSTLSTGLSTK